MTRPKARRSKPIRYLLTLTASWKRIELHPRKKERRGKS